MTLVELIVALSLLGLVSAMLFGSLRIGGSAWGATAASSQSMDQVVFSQLFLRRQLSQAVTPPAATDSDSPSVPRFEGDESTLTFTAPWLTHVGQGALFDFRVFVDGGHLILSWRPTNRNVDVALAEANEFIGRRTLTTGVQNMRVRYYGDVDDDQGMRWRTIWHHRSRLPQLLSVEVNYTHSDRKEWPKLLVMLAS